MVRPTRFDRIAVAIVQEELPALAIPDIPLDSLKNIARFVYHTLRLCVASLLPAVRLPGLLLDTRAIEPNNVAHLLLDIIPEYLYAKSLVGPEVTLIARKMNGQFRSLLEAFNIAPVREDRKVQASAVKVRGTRGLSVYDLPVFDCPVITCVPDISSNIVFPSSAKFERIFMARRGQRSLRNQGEIEGLLTEFGYKTIFMEDYPISDQLSIGTHARHVVALHGAAMSYLVLSKRLDSVIELFPAHVHHELYPVSIGPRVLSYHQIVPDFDPAVMHSGWETILHFKSQSFSVDPGLVRRLLSQIHSRSA
jgi:capsular polysaccharide biosynthesis protein